MLVNSMEQCAANGRRAAHAHMFVGNVRCGVLPKKAIGVKPFGSVTVFEKGRVSVSQHLRGITQKQRRVWSRRRHNHCDWELRNQHERVNHQKMGNLSAKGNDVQRLE